MAPLYGPLRFDDVHSKQLEDFQLFCFYFWIFLKIAFTNDKLHTFLQQYIDIGVEDEKNFLTSGMCNTFFQEVITRVPVDRFQKSRCQIKDVDIFCPEFL